jgi:hypothetical protein
MLAVQPFLPIFFCFDVNRKISNSFNFFVKTALPLTDTAHRTFQRCDPQELLILVISKNETFFLDSLSGIFKLCPFRFPKLSLVKSFFLEKVDFLLHSQKKVQEDFADEQQFCDAQVG